MLQAHRNDMNQLCQGVMTLAEGLLETAGGGCANIYPPILTCSKSPPYETLGGWALTRPALAACAYIIG